MSTILKTLKKLEEEKIILEQKADLKGLVLQGEDAVHLAAGREISRKWIFIGGGVLGAALIGGGLFFYSDLMKPKAAPTPSKTNLQPRLSAPVPQAPPKNQETFSGIPLVNIPEIQPAEPELERDFFESLEETREPAAAVVPEVESRQADAETNDDIRKIDELIKAATAAALQESPQQEPPLLHRRDVNFPDIRVKGIIFFSDSSPSNYIFVSTPQTGNRKLKVGDTVENASLHSITSQTAVFLYKGDRVEIPLGN